MSMTLNPKSLKPSERRAFVRLAIDRPCKVRRHSARFEQAHTLNVSTGGALLELRTPRAVTIDERLSVAVAWDDSPVLAHQALLPARVVRVDIADDGRQVVAVEYLHQHEHTLAAAA